MYKKGAMLGGKGGDKRPLSATSIKVHVYKMIEDQGMHLKWYKHVKGSPEIAPLRCIEGLLVKKKKN